MYTADFFDTAWDALGQYLYMRGVEEDQIILWGKEWKKEMVEIVKSQEDAGRMVVAGRVAKRKAPSGDASRGFNQSALKLLS